MLGQNNLHKLILFGDACFNGYVVKHQHTQWTPDLPCLHIHILSYYNIMSYEQFLLRSSYLEQTMLMMSEVPGCECLLEKCKLQKGTQVTLTTAALRTQHVNTSTDSWGILPILTAVISIFDLSLPHFTHLLPFS